MGSLASLAPCLLIFFGVGDVCCLSYRCVSRPMNSTFIGRIFSSVALNESQAIAVQEVAHHFACRHLCRTRSGCVAINLRDIGGTAMICHLYNGTRLKDELRYDSNSTVVLFLEDTCNETSTVDGVWSSWSSDVCPGPCPLLIHFQRRTCSKAKCNGHRCKGQDMRKLAPCEGTECKELQDLPNLTTSGVYLFNISGVKVPLYCERDGDGRVWIHIQRRVDGSVEFKNDWQTYKEGFGNVSHEFWLGNDNIHQLTKNDDMMIRFELFNGTISGWAEYTTFKVDSEEGGYRLTTFGFQGHLLPNQFRHHSGMLFSTFDKDQDTSPPRDCARQFGGGWWFHQCQSTSLNNQYWDGSARYILTMKWFGFGSPDGIVDSSVMKISHRNEA